MLVVRHILAVGHILVVDHNLVVGRILVVVVHIVDFDRMEVDQHFVLDLDLGFVGVVAIVRRLG